MCKNYAATAFQKWDGFRSLRAIGYGVGPDCLCQQRLDSADQSLLKSFRSQMLSQRPRSSDDNAYDFETTMRLIFAGPTIHGANLLPSADYALRPPARQGDFYKAVEDGANVIGLIDGVYEYVPAIWHKEILYGLSKGVHVFGAASMGALRAAECAPFGMVGIGEIYDGYASGRLQNDSDVAQSHAPAEMRYLPLSEPLVNVRATVSRCWQQLLITDEEHERLQLSAEKIFFKDRTYRHLVDASISDIDRAGEVLAILRANSVNLKLLDAQLLVQTVVRTPDQRFTPRFDWTFEATSFWCSLFPQNS